MFLKNNESFRGKRSELRHKIVDAIYEKIPADVVEHLGNANKELIFAIEGVFDSFVKRIDGRIAKSKESHLKSSNNGNHSEENNGEE